MKRERSTGGIQCPITAYIAGHVSPYSQQKNQYKSQKFFLLSSQSIDKFQYFNKKM